MASSAKHFINDPTELVSAALRAVTYTNPAVALDAEHKIVYRKAATQQSEREVVAIVSGGGSGHEPSFAAMVGRGLLTAAVAGTIFASPSAEQIRTAILDRVAAAGGDGGGVLVTVMNYTGDVLNFGMAVEKARAAGVAVEMVVVGDDVGVGRAQAGKVGRRGIAGTVLVHKISGALAARRAPLAAVAQTARLVADNLVSVGASLEHVHVPGQRRDVDGDGGGSGGEAGRLATDEVEIGMGIHNEPGCMRARELALPALVQTMLRQLLDDGDADRAFVRVPADDVDGDGNGKADVVLLINNLGGVSVLELGGITAEVVDQLVRDYNIRPARVLSGAFMTSLNGLGFSISLLNAVDLGLGPDGPSLLQLLDDPAEAPGWSASISGATWAAAAETTRTASAAPTATKAEATDTMQAPSAGGTVPGSLRVDATVFRTALERALRRVVVAEPEITEYDTVVGDGDCGTGMKRGAEALLDYLSSSASSSPPVSGNAVSDVAGLVPVVERSMDGTSGALYAIFLNALVHALRRQAEATSANANTNHQVAHVDWAAALRQSCTALGRYTPARPGDRTLVDALFPFVDVLEQTGGDLAAAAAAARAGAEKTKGMKASLGRAVYVGGSGFKKVPDPGAWGLACFFEGLAGQD